MINQTQRGRSMVEMLMMLALVGILSIVTFFGYEMAMAKYRSNTIIKETNQMAFNIEQQFEAEVDVLDLSEYQPDDCDWCDDPVEGEHNIRLAGYNVTVKEDEGTTAFMVTFMDVEQNVCEKLIATGWEDPYAIFVNEHPVPSALAVCEEANQIDVAFNNTLDAKAPDCNPGYGWNEENKKCEACPAGQHNNNNVCEECPENTFQNGTECVPCGSGAQAVSGSNKCECINPGFYWDKTDNACYPCTQSIAAERCEGVKCNDQGHCGGVGSNMFCNRVSFTSGQPYDGRCKETGGFRSITNNTNQSNSCISAGVASGHMTQAAINEQLANYRASAKVITQGSGPAWCAAFGWSPVSSLELGCPTNGSWEWDGVCTNAPLVHALSAGFATSLIVSETSGGWALLFTGCRIRWTNIMDTGAYYQRALCRVP